LGDGEDVDEVEEEFHRRDLAVAAVVFSQLPVALPLVRHAFPDSPLTWQAGVQPSRSAIQVADQPLAIGYDR
jgi:hypothetical protein